MKYCYHAEPIDQRPSRHLVPGDLALFLHNRNISFYSPFRAWSVAPGDLSDLSVSIQQQNQYALEGASVVLVWLPAGVPTVGVPMEMQAARDRGIPVVVFSDRVRGESAVLAEFPCDWTDNAGLAADAVAAHIRMAKARGDLIDALQETTMSITEASQWVTESYEEVVIVDDGPMFGKVALVEGAQHGPSAAPRPNKHGDAGYDLTCSETVVIEQGETGKVRTGISVQMPDGYWALVQGRSSSWSRGLLVKTSVIDAGYRGELWVDVANFAEEAVTVQAGERVGQLIPMLLPPPIVWGWVQELDPSERGSSGYGSTGL